MKANDSDETPIDVFWMRITTGQYTRETYAENREHWYVENLMAATDRAEKKFGLQMVPSPHPETAHWVPNADTWQVAGLPDSPT